MARYSISQPVTQVEAKRLLTGQGRYTDDIKLPFETHAVFLRSPHAHADIISIHTPLTIETRDMIKKDQLLSMKQDAIIINTARGKIIDFDALTESLKSNRLKAVGLDVLPVEPPDKAR